jgi:hypothetical protein
MFYVSFHATSYLRILCPLGHIFFFSLYASEALQEVLKVKFEGGSREGQLEVLEDGRVHDAEAADLLRLLAGELEVDGGGVAGEVGWVCFLQLVSSSSIKRNGRELSPYH